MMLHCGCRPTSKISSSDSWCIDDESTLDSWVEKGGGLRRRKMFLRMEPFLSTVNAGIFFS